MFLAIAVDNLADAESLTAIEKEEDEEVRKALKNNKRFILEVIFEVANSVNIRLINRTVIS